jgi:hypothetical protein
MRNTADERWRDGPSAFMVAIALPAGVVPTVGLALGATTWGTLAVAIPVAALCGLALNLWRRSGGDVGDRWP